MEYIRDVFIPETNKRLNSVMNLSEYFFVIGCLLIMACCVGHSFRLFLTQIFPFLSSMIRFFNRGRYRRGGTITRQHIFTYHGSVFLMSQSRSGLTTALSLGGCLSPTSLTLLGKSITQLRVLNIRLFIMLRSWRGGINP